MATQQQIDQQLQQMASTLGMTVDEVRTALSGVGDAANNATRQVGTFSQELAHGSKQIASSVSSFSGSLGKGQTSIASISGVITAMTGALGGVIKAIPQLGAVGQFTGSAIELMGDAASYTTGVLDDGLATFQELSRVGVVGSESIADLAKDIHSARMPMQMFKGLVVENSKQLAALQGTTGDAGSEFANVMGGMRKNMNMELRKIGFTTEEISETVINFADLQRRLGRGQRLTSVQLQEQTQEYARELDKVSKLTGMQRAEQQKLVDAAMREGRWRSTMEDLGGKQQTQMNMLNNSMSAFSSEMSEGLRDQASGFTQSEAAQKLFRTTNGASVEIMEKVKNGQLSAQEAMLAFQEAVKANKAPMKALNQAVGDQAGIYVRYNQSMDLLTADFNSLDEAVKKQQNQVSQQSDPTTAALVSLQEALQKASADISATLINSPNVAETLESAGQFFVEGTELFYQTFNGDFFTGEEPTRNASDSEAELNKLKNERRRLLADKAILEAPPSYLVDKGITSKPEELYTPEEKTKLSKINAQIEDLDTQLAHLNEVIKTETEKRTVSVSKILKQMGIEQSEREGIFTPLTPLQGSINDLLEGEHARLSDTISKEGGAQIRSLLEQAKADGVEIDKDRALWQKIYKIIADSSDSTGIFGSGNVKVKFPEQIKVEPGAKPLEVDILEKSTQILQAAPKMETGGVLSGPKSGYNVTMHGTEAVVPLPDKKGIPVNVQAESQTTKHIELLEKQVAKLTDVVSAIEDNTNVNNKILRVTQN